MIWWVWKLEVGSGCMIETQGEYTHECSSMFLAARDLETWALWAYYMVLYRSTFLLGSYCAPLGIQSM